MGHRQAYPALDLGQEIAHQAAPGGRVGPERSAGGVFSALVRNGAAQPTQISTRVRPAYRKYGRSRQRLFAGAEPRRGTRETAAGRPSMGAMRILVGRAFRWCAAGVRRPAKKSPFSFFVLSGTDEENRLARDRIDRRTRSTRARYWNEY